MAYGDQRKPSASLIAVPLEELRTMRNLVREQLEETQTLQNSDILHSLYARVVDAIRKAN